MTECEGEATSELSKQTDLQRFADILPPESTDLTQQTPQKT